MRQLILFIFVITFISCRQSRDADTLIGKWDDDNYWFEFHADNTYSGGIGPLRQVENALYSLNEKEHTLTLYTKNPRETYYLKYKIKGEDTLSVMNYMSSTVREVIYIKK